MPVDVRITPAVCGICSELAPESIRRQWDVFKAHVLTRESDMYLLAAFSYETLVTQTGRKGTGFKIFCALLTDKGSNGFDFDKETIITQAIYNRYWDLVIRDEYWDVQPVSKRTWVPYDRALEIWERTNKSEINFYEKRLELWLTKL
jgi:hypothetical protein